MTWTDSKCGAFVYGSYQHCPNCHRTFTSTAAGDAHRVGDYDDRACADPATVRRHDKDGNDLGPLFELNRWYAWAIRPTDTQRATHEAWLASKRGDSPAGMPLEAPLHPPTAAEQAPGVVQDREAS